MTKDLPRSTPVPQARILVVEDHPNTLEAVTQALELMGYQVEGAISGSEALNKISSTPYDLMLLDLRLPGMDGIEVMKQAHEICPDLLVIILTAYPTTKSAIAAVRTSVVDYLLKPCSSREIGTAVNRALRRRQEQLRQEQLLRTISEAAEALGGKGDREMPSSNPGARRVLRCGCVTLNYKKGTATVTSAESATNHTAELTPREADLLAYFIQYPGMAVSCQELARGAFGYKIGKREAQNLIRPHIYRLRKKIEPDPTSPRLVQTRYGRGYIFSPF